MKKWKVTIKANDEKQASLMLNMLVEAFKLAVLVNEPMDYSFMRTENKETLKCENVKY